MGNLVTFLLEASHFAYDARVRLQHIDGTQANVDTIGMPEMSRKCWSGRVKVETK